jgi:hypothetical protein
MAAVLPLAYLTARHAASTHISAQHQWVMAAAKMDLLVGSLVAIPRP